MVLFNTASKPACEWALNVLQNMDPQIQTAVPKYSGNFAVSWPHMLTPMGAHRVPYLPCGPTQVLGSSSVLSLHLHIASGNKK